MKTLQAFRVIAQTCCIILALSLNAAHADSTSTVYTPSVGQPGKDVVWVPSPQALVDRMLEMAKVTPSDFLVDLGSGDGRTVITAAKRGVTSLGIEYNPDLVALSQNAAEAEGVTKLARFIQGDIFETDFSKATVVTMFLLPDLNLRLRPKLLEMKPGTRLVSNSFDMDDWEADERVEAGGDCTQYCRAFLWIVPAKVVGTWQLPGGQLSLNQKYQMVSGTMTLAGKESPITNGRLNGDTISFVVDERTMTGRVSGNTIELKAESPNGPSTLTATRS
jgi:Methyltransferase domain